ncbi:MAG: sodium:proton antiporter [Clostridia bacterium]|nr:sodium:proton antiporter [Clostridia bacterium]
MKWWQNIPFFLVWVPLLCASLTAVLPCKASQALILLFPALGTVLSGVLYLHVSGNMAFYTFPMGLFGAPFGNELRYGTVEAIMAGTFCLVLFLSLLGGWKRLQEHIAPERKKLYCVMVMLLLSSMMAEVFTNDMFTAYVFIEITTIAACALIVARTRGRTLFAATQYMIFNMLGSGLYLLGISVLYCMTGHLLMVPMHEKIEAMMASGEHLQSLTLSVTLMTIGLGIKSALYPFHRWLPDAYEKCTPSSSAMLSSLISKTYLFLYIKILVRVVGLQHMNALDLRPVLVLCAFGSILMGSIDALLEKKMRRMIADSSVAQIGYIYLGIAVGTEAGIAAALFHIIAHALAKSLLFLSGDRLIGASDEDADFHELCGAGFRAPFSGAAFTVGALSITGIPLLAGFASKLYLSQACLTMPSRWAFAGLIVLAISTALTASYFLITVITIYRTPMHAYHAPVHHPWYSTAALLILAGLLVVVGVCGSSLYTSILSGIPYLI